MEEDKEYRLEFLSFDVSKALFERKTSEKEYQFHIEAKNAIIDIDKEENVFRCGFLIDIKSLDEDKPLSIQIEAGGIFKIHDDPPMKVIQNFKIISSPSIVYPYIRAFIANLTLNAGVNPINLPPINFVKRIQDTVE